MRIVITGGAGFIGSHVADEAIERGHEVLVLDDLSTGRRANVPEGARFNHLDIRNGATVRRSLARFRPDVVCHQAAQTSVSVSTKEPRRDAEVNVLGSLEVLEAAVACGVERVVFASTGGAIYGEIPDGVRASEGMPERPLSPYACSKLAVERYLACYEHS
ncbi:MAG: NAD-dependent epimerase/dehydratase family protein, partial [Myxococcales bacterium]